MFDGTSFPAVCFLSAETPLTRRLLVYFDSGAYIWPFCPPVGVIPLIPGTPALEIQA